MPMKMAMKSGGNKPLSKGAFCTEVAEKCGVKKKVVVEMLDQTVAVAVASLAKTGKVTIPGLCMIKTRQKPATKACVKNIFGKETKIAAMKAKTVVKAFPVKALKDCYK